MAITRYIPPTKNIIDNRKPEGGYYEADCEVCGGKFYPERSNAKYCTPNCGLIAHRIAVANGTATKRTESKPIATVTTKKTVSTIVVGRDSVVGLLHSKGVRTHGVRVLLKDLAIGETSKWQNVSITRTTASKYEVK